MPDPVLLKLDPGKSRAFIVNVACGVLNAVDPLNVRSGTILRIYKKRSPSSMSMTADSMNELIAADERVEATAIQTVGAKSYDGFALLRVK